jgi:hypothetical protein
MGARERDGKIEERRVVWWSGEQWLSEDRGMSKTFDVSGGSASPSVRRWEDSANVLKINGCIGTGFSQG